MPIIRKLAALLRRNRLDVDMAEEMRAHLDEQIARNLAAGMGEKDARANAHRQFGGVAQIQEQARDARGWVWFTQLLQDCRFTLRILRKAPGFAAVAVVSLAIGIGLNTAVFSVINAVFYQTIRGVPEPERVLIFNDGGASADGYRLLREQAVDVAAISMADRLDAVIETDTSDRRGTVLAVPADYFAVLGARTALGRFFLPPAGTAPEYYAAPEAVLTHAFWQRNLAGDPAVLGRVLRVNGVSVTVVGVAARAFHGPGPEGPALWVPFGLGPMLRRPVDRAPAETFRLIGRLRPGVTLGQAQAAIAVAAARSPEVFGATRFRLSAGREDWRGEDSPQKRVERMLVTVVPLVVVGGLLWIACSNVGNLLLARATQRRKEIAIRLATGASRARLIRMLMVESVVLALLGGAAGLGVSGATLRFIFATLSEFGALSVQLDLRVLLYTTAICLVAALLFGLVPALQASRTDVNSALKGDGDPSRSRPARLRAFFLASQLATSVALLVVAGTFIKSLIADAYVGRQARLLDHLVLAQVPAARPAGASGGDRHDLLEQLRALPGIDSATMFDMNPATREFAWPGEPVPNQAPPPTVALRRIDPAYAQTTDLELRGGVMLAPVPAEGGLRQALVNEAMAREFWPESKVVGARFDLNGEAFVAVGVVRDGDSPPTAYTQLPPTVTNGLALLIRTRATAAGQIPVIAALLRTHAAENELLQVAPFRDVAFRTVGQLARLSAGIGGLALCLAAAGVYASMSFSTSQRTHEIGVRMALGATRRNVLALVFRGAFSVIGWGVAIGLVLAMVGLRLLFGLLSGGGSGVDLPAMAAVILFFAAIAGLACLMPAWRAARVDPLVALRAE